jgi:N-methylhydantoinase B
VDVIFGALSKAVPDKIPSASYGTMTNVCFGGWDADKNREFAYYETIAGGMGARADKDGESGVHMHMTNTANTPIEVLENLYPVRLTCYRLRKNSGGSGKFTGGEGVIREFEFLCDAHVTVLSDRRLIAPYGLYGGKAGKKGKNLLITKKGETVLPGKFDIKVQKGQRICFLTPGGGGHGRKQTP